MRTYTTLICGVVEITLSHGDAIREVFDRCELKKDICLAYVFGVRSKTTKRICEKHKLVRLI